MTPDQLRQARLLLGCSTYQVAAWSGVGQQVIATFEKTGRVMRSMSAAPAIDRLRAVRTALETAGIEFVDTESPSVRLRSDR